MRLSMWLVLALLFSGTVTVRAGDWPTYRADPARSGYTSEPIPNQLRQRWVFHPGAAPRRAWVGSERIEYDLAFQPILVGDTVLFGSSADDTVYALDATTGLIRWRFHAEGPVRFAPVAADGRVFLASDDGWLYALDLGTGELAWKHRGGPDPDRVVGNGRVISRWAARGGPAVADGLVYYTAGIWPSEGVFIHTLSTKNGEVAWSNVESGRIEMKQPHGGAVAVSGVAPQGYLALAEDAVVVPTGRAVPAVFDRGSGTLRYYKLQENQQQGGTRTAVIESSFLNTGCLFDLASGALASRVGLGPAVVTPTGLLRAEGRSLMVSTWTEAERFDRKGNPEKVRQLVQKQIVPLESEVTEVIVAGEDAIVGGEGWVGAIDFLGQRTMWWHAPVDGVVRGGQPDALVVARGDGDVRSVLQGEGQHETAAVVGVLADEVDAPRRRPGAGRRIAPGIGEEAARHHQARASRSMAAARSGAMSLIHTPAADSDPARYFIRSGARRVLNTSRKSCAPGAPPASGAWCQAAT